MELISCYLSIQKIKMINDLIERLLQKVSDIIEYNISKEDSPCYFAYFGYISNEVIEDLQWFINFCDSSNLYRIVTDSDSLIKIDELSEKLRL
ncbi:hypothetical protein [Anoxybacillus sp. FSL W8-1294]|uniref:hypothetical protein n=1 Tax=Anoxybacillus sp. FSL W8-1294 TaxID=2954655 RepID=UPI0030D27983